MNVRAAEWTEGARWSDLLDLTKPRITLMVVLTTALGFYLGSPRPFPLLTLIHVLVGVSVLAAGAAALNQVVEKDADSRMRRTAQRPIPAGRVDAWRARQFGIALSVVGVAYLLFFVNALTAGLGIFTLGSYLFVYTPLKKRSPVATLVGAVPGAVPPMMGWTAVRGELDLGAWILFGILFFWQLPHSLAIAWVYREDYERGGFALLPLRDPTGKKTSRHMVLTCVALVTTSLLPTAVGVSGLVYLVAASVLGLLFLGSCVGFATSQTALAARRVMWVSILYLPAVLAVMTLSRWV